MVNTRPNFDPDGYYTATEAAPLMGVERHYFKRYLKPHIRKCNNQKLYKGSELLELWEDVTEIAELKAKEREEKNQKTK